MKASKKEGGDPWLKKLVEMMLENLSTREVFLFRIACGVCGAEFANTPHRFSRAGVPPRTESRRSLFDALYEQEFRDARNSAIRTAAEHMNYCPICKRLVCNRCFLICDDLDMCKQCAAKLEETGSPVLTDAIEAVV